MSHDLWHQQVDWKHMADWDLSAGRCHLRSEQGPQMPASTGLSLRVKFLQKERHLVPSLDEVDRAGMCWADSIWELNTAGFCPSIGACPSPCLASFAGHSAQQLFLGLPPSGPASGSGGEGVVSYKSGKRGWPASHRLSTMLCSARSLSPMFRGT